ncbi:MAG: FHA domain-containing protein [Massilibacteroides sp.]|nr:FHA domain-containing protein [Massilibacteroides sp.]MDD3061354.1 FHA domain-containing protein [Massilibacteroides sp.]MDD4114650.1 FHA domain-containing protein [Massilibacteroides sp.]MDD4659445.1 FHA domain-containing protein [Massilibacteroides sp.]
MIIKIGKATDNDFIINNLSVSRYHANLFFDNEGGWILEDLNSTNGTFINGVQVLKKKITTSDPIRFGNSEIFFLQDLLHANNDYSEDFAQLKDVYRSYVQEKIKIQSSNQLKTRLLQSLPFAIPGIIGVIIGFLGKGNQTIFAISLCVTILAPAVGIYLGARQASKIPMLLQSITDNFKIKYVCPKCGHFLGEIPWESLLNKKQCPACKAKWTKE